MVYRIYVEKKKGFDHASGGDVFRAVGRGAAPGLLPAGGRRIFRNKKEVNRNAAPKSKGEGKGACHSHRAD